MAHSVAGFQAGCRCPKCEAAELARISQIGQAETQRWEPVNARADRVWEQQTQQPPIYRQWIPWTDEHIQYALDKSRTVREVARVLGRSVGSVTALRRKLRNKHDVQVTPPPPAAATDPD